MMLKRNIFLTVLFFLLLGSASFVMAQNTNASANADFPVSENANVSGETNANISVPDEDEDENTAKQDVRELLPEQTIEREIGDYEAQFYKFDLQKGEFFQIRVEQKGADIYLRLLGADETVLAVMDSPNGAEGSETLTFVAEEAGSFTLQASNYYEKGSYTIRRETSRAANEQDLKRVETERVFMDAQTAKYEEPQLAKTKFEEALRGFQELGDDYLSSLITESLESLRETLERNKIAERAYALFEEGKELLAQNAAKSKREGIKKLEQARLLYREVGYTEAEFEILLLLGKISELPNYETSLRFKKAAAHIYKLKLEGGKIFRIGVKFTGDDLIIGLMSAERELLKAGYHGEGFTSVYYTPQETSEFLLVIANTSEKPQGNYFLQKDAPFANDYEKADVASDLHLQGNDANNEKNYELAVSYHEQALKLKRELNDDFSLGRTMEWLASDYDGLKKYEDALKLYLEAAEVYKKSGYTDDYLRMLQFAGNTCISSKQFERALDIFRKRLEIAGGLELPVEVGSSLNFIGDVYQNMNQPIRAVEYFGQALAVMRQEKDSLGEIWTLRRLGRVYRSISQNVDALEHYQMALRISREIASLAEEQDSLNGVGRAYLGLGRYEDSIKIHERELEIARELQDRRGEAVAFAHLGLNYYYLGQYDKAIEFDKMALKINREINDLGEQAVMLNNIGVIYRNLGSYNKAIEFLTQSLEIDNKLGNRRKEALAFSNLATTYLHLEQLDKSIEYFEQAIPILREYKENDFLATSLIRYGIVLRKKNQIERAVILHKEALSLSRLIKLRPDEGYALSELGWDLLEQNQPEKAVANFEQALTIYREVKERRGEISTLRGLTEAWNRLGQKSLAVFYGKQAVNLLQTIRRDISGFEKDVQTNFVSDNEKVYRKTAEILIAAGRLAEAEQITNLLKQEEYFDYTRRDPNDPTSMAKDTAYTPEEEKARAEYLKQAGKITEIGRRVEELNLKRPRTPQEDQELILLQRDLEAATKEFQEFLQKLVRQFPDKKAGWQQTLRVEDSEAFMETLRVLGEETGQPGRVAAIYTIVGEKQLSLMVVTSQNRVAETVDISEEELHALVNDFRVVLRDKTIDPRPLGARLYEKVFAPIEKHIAPLTKSADGETEEIITLMWSLDGTLRYVPIAALYDESRKKYMVERFRNTVFTFKSKGKLEAKPSPGWSALGLGVTEKRSESGINFDPLPKVKDELAIIGDEEKPDETKPLNGKVLENETFKLETMRLELNRKRQVVHIASHFNFAPTNDDESFLLLGEGKWTVTQMRGMGQIFSGVQLLTLSACNTAMGRRDATGKEVDGFGAFAQDKGAQAVIATLWAVADDSTSELMQKFYQLRAEDTSLLKAEALRRSQLDLIYGKYTADEDIKNRSGLAINTEISKQPKFKKDDNAQFAHPYFWSPFILIGNWR